MAAGSPEASRHAQINEASRAYSRPLLSAFGLMPEWSQPAATRRVCRSCSSCALSARVWARSRHLQVAYHACDAASRATQAGL